MDESQSVLDFPHATVPGPSQAHEIAPGVHWLRMPLPFALDHINLWMIEDGEGFAIVDCGLGDQTTRDLWNAYFAAAHGVGTGGSLRVSRVIVTHCHPDHAGNAHWLAHRFGADLWISFGEYFTAHAARESQAGFSIEFQLDLFHRNGLEREWIERMKERSGGFRRGVPEFPRSFCRLMDGQSLSIGARRWKVIMGYGHSPEHAALYCESLGVLISGDMVLPKITTNISVWTVEPEANPLGLFLNSLQRYAALPANTLVLPSHGLPFRGLHERIAQLHGHHRLRLSEVAEACVSPKSAADIVPTLFRRTLDAHQMFFAMGESMAHLHFLHAEGRLERRTGADGVFRYAQV
jgi:glyoxylase-like metal-dependent hydrolase (beta-lactamase superfamily II)